MRILLVSALLIAVSVVGAANTGASDTDTRGRLCIASLAPPTPGPKSLANPRGGDPNINYSIRIDSGSVTAVSSTQGQWLDALSTSDQHVLSVYAEGKRVESFKFSFPADTTELCLFNNSLYGTWQLWPMKRTRCDCSREAGSPNSSLDPTASRVTSLAGQAPRHSGRGSGVR